MFFCFKPLSAMKSPKVQGESDSASACLALWLRHPLSLLNFNLVVSLSDIVQKCVFMLTLKWLSKHSFIIIKWVWNSFTYYNFSFN